MRRRELLLDLAGVGLGLATLTACSSASDQIFTFQATNVLPETTKSALPAQILVVINEVPAKPNFGAYVGEMTRSEGFSTDVIEVSELDQEKIGVYSTVIMAENTATAAQIPALEKYLSAGGNLVLMRPEDPAVAQFAEIENGLEVEEGYVQVWPERSINPDFPRQPLPVHGKQTQTRFGPGYTVLAGGFRHQGEQPVPIAGSQKKLNGRLNVLNFQAALSLIYGFMGNPEWVGKELDGADGLRATDRFAGKNADGSAWVDVQDLQYPFLDFERRFLTNLILAGDRDLVLQVGLFPNGSPAVFYPTSDIHARPPHEIENYFKQFKRGESSSVYYAGPKFFGDDVKTQIYEFGRRFPNLFNDLSSRPLPTTEQVHDWQKRNFEVSMHPYIGNTPYWHPTTKDALAGFADAKAELNELGVNEFNSARWHAAVALADSYAGLSQIMAEEKIGAHLFQYTWGPFFKDLGAKMAVVFPGSFYPMRASNEHGELVPTYLWPTGLVDEELLRVVKEWGQKNWAAYLGLDQAKAVTTKMFQIALEHQLPVTSISHVDYLSQSDALAWLQFNLQTARNHKLPIRSVEQGYRFLQGRESLRSGQPRLVDNRYELTVSFVNSSNDQIPLMLPYWYQNQPIRSAWINSERVNLMDRVISGRPHQVLLLPQLSGEYNLAFSA